MSDNRWVSMKKNLRDSTAKYLDIVKEFGKVDELIYDIYKYQHIKIASLYSSKKKWQKKSGGNPIIYLRRM